VDDAHTRARDAIRALDESDGDRSYWHSWFEEERTDGFSEVVEDYGEEWHVKQFVVHQDGVRRRYWWCHLEDDDGFLADQPLDRSAAGLEVITAEEFFAQWDHV